MVLFKLSAAPVQKLFDLRGKIVAVTGGGQGIGHAVCTACAEAGAEVSKIFRKLDLTVANAGICSEHVGREYTPEQLKEITNVNVKGAFYTAQAAAKAFRSQVYDNVVFTAPVSATLVNTPQRQAAYNASKAGVLQLARSLAMEWVDFCRVNCVSPGYTQTKMTEYVSPEVQEKWLSQIPARRFASPYELKGVG
ncbi:hypothetical protein BBP40_001394 [Aspergillus hancockii]|nr:hypothetical protein BBP40_001394 [Aspergillus hancockii]